MAAKIVHVSSAHPWTDNRIHYRECETLAAAGLDVTLIAVEASVAGPVSGVRVIRIPQRTRLSRWLFSSPQAVWLAIRSRARVVHLHDPELAWSIPLLRGLGRRVVFDAHEDLPVDVLNKPYIPGWAQPALALFASFVVWLGSRANRVVAATESIAERFPDEKTVVVHNYPPLVERDEDLRGPRENAAVYIGAMSAIRGTRELLAAVDAESFPQGWHLVLAGTATPEVSEIVQCSADSPRVQRHRQLPPDEARALLLRARVGIVPFQRTPAHQESLPTKMFEYFAAGLPVIASDFPLWRRIVSDHECGILVDSSEPAAIARAVGRYAEDPELWRSHSRNARSLAVEELNWAPEGRKLVELYRDLAG
ncbi:glycosyl transferase family 1 [Microbacterium sp. HM58-2]|nr:glycosyl transferase family 1 [Microbacterium sp. HM58-2]